MHSISEYSYDLPEELIAQVPAEERSSSKLMVLDRVSGALRHEQFEITLAILKPGDALVMNDTKVIPARVEARRSSGGFVELFLLEQKREGEWEALARPSARIREGEALNLECGGNALMRAYLGSGTWSVRFDSLSAPEDLYRLGRMPMPQYISRDRFSDARDDLDRESYHTVYAAIPGAVAAPTAGLHFTPVLLERAVESGIILVKLTLHVGVGTFAPIREEDITLHRIHEERFVFDEKSAKTLNMVKGSGGRVVAVGTTSARVLETVAHEDGSFHPASGRTSLYIYPPYRFKAVDLLLTNFHLPRSSLLLLVSAFAGRENVIAAYQEAVRKRYRFYSYGDAMLICDNPTRKRSCT